MAAEATIEAKIAIVKRPVTARRKKTQKGRRKSSSCPNIPKIRSHVQLKPGHAPFKRLS